MKSLLLILFLVSPVMADPMNYSTYQTTYTFHTFAPSTRLVFGSGKHEGYLDWSKGKIEFGGDLKYSARRFFNYVKPFLDEYIAAGCVDKK